MSGWNSGQEDRGSNHADNGGGDATRQRNDPKGEHVVKAIKLAWDTDKNGTPCIAALVEIVEGEHAGFQSDGRLYLDETPGENTSRTNLDRALEVLADLGHVGDFPMTFGELKGTCKAVFGVSSNGYPKINFLNPMVSRPRRELRLFEAPEPAQLAAFLGSINKRTAAISEKTSASGSKPLGRPAQEQQQRTSAPPQQRTAAPPQQRASDPASQRPTHYRNAPPQSQEDDEIPFERGARQ